jgi:hypothetical protein
MMAVRVIRHGIAGAAVVSLLLAGSSTAQSTLQLNAQQIFTLDLAGTSLDEFPASVKALSGVMTVVDKNGQHMLKASSPSEFLITLPQALPADFTVVLDFIPKACCAPDDIMLEGTPTMNRGPASAQLTWQPERISVVGGSADMYQASMPADLAASTPGNLTQVVVEFSGTTIKLYTNGRRLYTLDKQFARGRVLRVWLGGADEGLNAVYLAGLRISAGTGLGSIASGGLPLQNNPPPGTSFPATGSGEAPTKLTGSSNPVVGSGTSGDIATQQSAAMASGSFAGTPTSLMLTPIGAGAAWPPAPVQSAGTSMTMSLGGAPFSVKLLSGGSMVANVQETRSPDGSIKKQATRASPEPLDFEVALGSPVQDWLKSSLLGAAKPQNGAVSGGFVPSQQELDFTQAELSRVTIPLLDASSTAPASLRVMITPQSVTQGALTVKILSTLTSRLRTAPWTSADFRFTMGNLETRRTSRIESFTITPAAAGQPGISNVLVTVSVDAASPATNWLAWYDDFVVKGNSGDNNEKSFTLELGGNINAGGQAQLILKGYGVGIVALRALPAPAGSNVQLLQAELYVERMETSQ